VALIAASQPISNDRQLSIITHDGSASDQDGWSVIPLMYVEKPGFFNSNTIIAGLEDIWVHDGLVVAVGWRYYQEIGQFRGLIFARFLP
jgi:hypothetical protein